MEMGMRSTFGGSRLDSDVNLGDERRPVELTCRSFLSDDVLPTGTCWTSSTGRKVVRAGVPPGLSIDICKALLPFSLGWAVWYGEETV
jgi:hypothetical protein